MTNRHLIGISSQKIEILLFQSDLTQLKIVNRQSFQNRNRKWLEPRLPLHTYIYIYFLANYIHMIHYEKCPENDKLFESK